MNKMNIFALCVIFSLFQSTHAMMQRAFGVEAKKNITSQLQKSKLQKRFHNSDSYTFFNSDPHPIDFLISFPAGFSAGCGATMLVAPIAGWRGMLAAGTVSGIVVAGKIGGKGGAAMLAATIAAGGLWTYLYEIKSSRTKIQE